MQMLMMMKIFMAKLFIAVAFDLNDLLLNLIILFVTVFGEVEVFASKENNNNNNNNNNENK